ncbi:MAG: choice-of-anchor Q domain-containing protein [Thermomicrobiales bacterium]
MCHVGRPWRIVSGVVLLLGLFLLCVQPAHVSAATVTVTIATDTTDPTCVSTGAAPCSLRDAIAYANANDSTTITFQPGLIGPIILTQVLTLTLTRTSGSGTTITGPGVASLAVDGGYTGGSTGVTVFTTNTNVTATITGLTIQNGNSGGLYGGGVKNSGSLTLANVIVRANRSYIGGGVYNSNTGSLTTGVSTMIGGTMPADANIATGSGGGITNEGTLIAQPGLTISGNQAYQGGGIYNAASLMTGASTIIGGVAPTDANTAIVGGGIYNVGTWNAQAGLTISNNTATQAGGGIYNDSGARTVTLTAPTISKNQVTAGGAATGGGIVVNTNGTMTITGGTIAGNQVVNGASGGGGGGIFNGGTLTLDAVTVGGTNASDANTTTNGVGGGIFATGMLTLQNNTTILGNTAGNHGGGIFISSSATAIITNSTIGGTTAGSGNTTGGGGGGIHNSAGILTMSGSRVSGNLATGINGGGGILNGGSATITNSTIGGTTTAGGNSAPNGSGGGIGTGFGSTLHVTGSTISGNSASSTAGAGGGILIVNTSAVIDTTTIGGATAASGNSAFYGGGIETQGSPPSSLTLTNSTVSHNTTTGSAGGGIYSSISSVTITGSTISANTTTGTSQPGGGIESGGGPTMITNSTISNNSATGVGGAIDNPNGNVALTLTHVTLAGNSTGINTAGGTTIKNSILANTGANCTGVAITDGHYNLDSGTTCGFTDPSDLSSTNPQLGPLQDNGGPTQTQALLIDSPAINTIPATGGCNGAGVPNDQRGVTRPFGLKCDIGAVEFAFIVSPSSGSVTGGTTLRLIGAGFTPDMTVKLGPNTCTNLVVNGAGTGATCTIPPHGIGTVDVTLTRNARSVALTGYTYGVVNALPTPQPTIAVNPMPPTPLPVPRPMGAPVVSTPLPLPSPRPS